MTHRRPNHRLFAATAALLLTVGATPALAQSIPTPEEHFGFGMGTEGELARWDGILEYYTAIAAGTIGSRWTRWE